VQQRTAQAQLEDHRKQVQELSQAKKQLQADVADLHERLDAESTARNAEAGGFIPMESLYTPYTTT
jgi:myosin protein heavy chain